MYKDKILLITGGTGSFGSAILHLFLKSDLGQIRILSRDEKKQDDLRKKFNNSRLKFFIGDVRDYSSVLNATRGANYIFHAAALKQVPSCEFHPMQAVNTNILGTENVLEAAINNQVKKVVCLSTDKAVYPINAMGISKALMEKVMIAKSRNLDKSETIICGTRYGNVMASRGSVIPLFLSQIQNNQKLTVTDPNMTRFMMTLDDAVDLVIYAFKNGNNGDIFVQKAPAADIGTIASCLLELMNSDLDIDIIGTRHGEKLHEVLLSREEKAVALDLGNYYRVPQDNRDLDYSKYVEKGDKKIDQVKEDYNSFNTYRLNKEETKDLLLKLSIIKELLVDLKRSQS